VHPPRQTLNPYTPTCLQYLGGQTDQKYNTYLQGI